MSTNLSSIHVDIITPDATVFTQDGVDMVVARALDGEFGILKNHAPLVAVLDLAPMRIKRGGEETIVAVFGGFLEVKDNVVTVIARAAEEADYIDTARAMRARDRALRRLESKDPDIDRVRAELALRRAMVRLQAAGGTKVE